LCNFHVYLSCASSRRKVTKLKLVAKSEQKWALSLISFVKRNCPRRNGYRLCGWGVISLSPDHLKRYYLQGFQSQVVFSPSSLRSAWCMSGSVENVSVLKTGNLGTDVVSDDKRGIQNSGGRGSLPPIRYRCGLVEWLCLAEIHRRSYVLCQYCW